MQGSPAILIFVALPGLAGRKSRDRNLVCTVDVHALCQEVGKVPCSLAYYLEPQSAHPLSLVLTFCVSTADDNNSCLRFLVE